MQFSFLKDKRIRALIVSILVVTGLGIASFAVPVPYVTMRPGPVFDTLGKIENTPMFTFGDDVKTYPTDGSLYFTSVSVTRAETKIYLIEAMEAWFQKDTVIVPHDLVYPDDESNKESDESGAAMLANSQGASTVAAVRAAGMTVAERVLIESTVPSTPAEGVLKKGDQITAVDGKKVATVRQAVDAISDRKPGDKVTISVIRQKKPLEFTIETIPMEGEPTLPRVGVIVMADYDVPIEVENHIGDRVGGPSAGMMFALSMYDQLTPGPLTAGKSIAGTGSISSDGQVGTVGGIAQKMAGAEDAGASVFLIPAENCGEFLKARDFDMTVVKVSTLKDAISSIEALTDNPKAKVPSC